MILLILVLFFYWGIQKLNNHEKVLRVQIETKEIQIKKIRSLSNEWSQLQRAVTAPIMPQALSSFVENVARSLNIQDNLQLNVLNNVNNGIEGVKVGLDRLELNNFISMLYQLENHRPVLKISYLNISISPGDRQIRASFQVHKQQES